MKDYKKLMPVIMIAFTLLAFYSRITQLQGKEKEYNNYLAQAREYREGKIYVDAIAQYKSALKLNASLDLYEEIAEMYQEEGNKNHITKWGERLIEEYPEEKYGYLYLINYYVSQERYSDCFSLYDKATRRGIVSEELEAAIKPIEYTYRINTVTYETISEYAGGYCYVLEDNIYSYCNADGNLVKDREYLQAGAYNGELASVKSTEEEFYFVDQEGNRKINVPKNIEVTRIGYLNNDLYPVGKEGEMYYADVKGNLVLGPYEDAGAFTYDRAAVKENGQWYLIDLTGNKLSDGYQGFAMDVRGAVMRNNAAFALTDAGYVMIDIDGKKAGKEVYEDARCFLDNTYTAVKKDGLWGFIDNTGKMCIQPQYEDAKAFINGLAAIKKDGLWGYITAEGIIAIKPAFYEANSMNEKGITFVQVKEGTWSKLSLTRIQTLGGE